MKSFICSLFLLTSLMAQANGVQRASPCYLSGSSVACFAPINIASGGTNATSYTTGSIPYFNGTSLAEDNANLFWDGTNHRLGIGTTTPKAGIDATNYVRVLGSVGAASGIPATGEGLEFTYDTNAQVGNIYTYVRPILGFKTLQIDGLPLIFNKNAASYAEASNYVRFIGSAGAATGNPTSGSGLEITYNTTTDLGSVFAYNRSTSAFKKVEINGSSTYLNSSSGGNVGIGTTTTPSLLTVASGSKFQVDSSGNIVKVNNVTTSFPASQGAASTLLQNDGAGNLTWSAAAVTASGTYAPSITGQVNITTSLVGDAQYMRVGSTVTVSGTIDINTTLGAGTDTNFNLSLPVASVFTTIRQLGGVISSGGTSPNGEAGRIFSDAATGTAFFDFNAFGAANRTFTYTYTYQIL